MCAAATTSTTRPTSPAWPVSGSSSPRWKEKLRQQDSQFAAEAYTALEDYMVTDIASGTAAKIGEKLKQYKQLDTLTIDGENVIENGYWGLPSGRVQPGGDRLTAVL